MQRRRGFTLWEVIVVVIIFAILGGIAGPRYLAAQQKADIARGASTLQLAVLDADEQFVTTGQGTVLPHGTGDDEVVWYDSDCTDSDRPQTIRVSGVDCVTNGPSTSPQVMSLHPRPAENVLVVAVRVEAQICVVGILSPVAPPRYGWSEHESGNCAAAALVSTTSVTGSSDTPTALPDAAIS